MLSSLASVAATALRLCPGVRPLSAPLLRAGRCPLVPCGVRLAAGDAVDLSHYPALAERELEERFVRGNGPGGQSVNKTANAVSLRHLPTGLLVKCHESRSLEENRRRARLLLADRLDALLNGQQAVSAQLERRQAERQRRRDAQRRRRDQRKQAWLRQRSQDDEPGGSET